MSEKKDIIQIFDKNLQKKYGKDFVAKQIIIPEGDTKKEVYVILKGEVYVTTKILTGYRVITTLGEGEIFGEMAFFDDTPRTATIIAKTKVKAVVLTPENFKEFFKNSPEWALNIINFLCSRIAATMKDIENLYA